MMSRQASLGCFGCRRVRPTRGLHLIVSFCRATSLDRLWRSTASSASAPPDRHHGHHFNLMPRRPRAVPSVRPDDPCSIVMSAPLGKGHVDRANQRRNRHQDRPAQAIEPSTAAAAHALLMDFSHIAKSCGRPPIGGGRHSASSFHAAFAACEIQTPRRRPACRVQH